MIEVHCIIYPQFLDSEHKYEDEYVRTYNTTNYHSIRDDDDDDTQQYRKHVKMPFLHRSDVCIFVHCIAERRRFYFVLVA